MVKIPNRSRKIFILKRIQDNKCACGCGLTLPSYPSYGESLDLHHGLSDSAKNRALYPRFIHSVLNLFAVLHNCHMGQRRISGPLPSITPYQAARYEGFLERHPAISDWVNGKTLFIFRKAA